MALRNFRGGDPRFAAPRRSARFEMADRRFRPARDLLPWRDGIAHADRDRPTTGREDDHIGGETSPTGPFPRRDASRYREEAQPVRSRHRIAVLLATASLVFAACSGGGGATPSASTAAPASQPAGSAPASAASGEPVTIDWWHINNND